MRKRAAYRLAECGEDAANGAREEAQACSECARGGVGTAGAVYGGDHADDGGDGKRFGEDEIGVATKGDKSAAGRSGDAVEDVAPGGGVECEEDVEAAQFFAFGCGNGDTVDAGTQGREHGGAFGEDAHTAAGGKEPADGGEECGDGDGVLLGHRGVDQAVWVYWRERCRRARRR